MKNSANTIIETVFGDSWYNYSEEARNAVSKLLSWVLKSPVNEPMMTLDERIMTSLQLACVEVFSQTMDELMCRGKKQDDVEKRYMVFCTAKDLSKSSSSTIAKMFPSRNRSTIIYHARQKLNDLCDVDKRTEALYSLFHSTTEEYLKIFTNESNNSN